MNWGLGHATRSIPIIRKLASQENEIHIAAAGDALQMLKIEFPQLPFLELPDYEINYSYKSIIINGLSQYKSVIKKIKIENEIINSYCKNKNFELIISDNAFGVFHYSIKSILITHQLKLPLPKGLNFLSPIIQRLYMRFLKPFSEIWVPDNLGNDNLSGKLSHGVKVNSKVEYIGIQSRFTEFDKKLNIEIKYDLAIILSGPEPSRTELEQKIMNLLPRFSGNVSLVCGKFSSQLESNLPNLDIFDFLDSKQLFDLINSSKVILCRSGYSSLMDLASKDRKAIIIPTPGQTEQEYLAEYHNNKGRFFSISQSDLNIELLNLLIKKASL